MRPNYNAWVKSVNGLLDPPGCETLFTQAPSGFNECCTIGIVFEHRFAFYYWARFAAGNKQKAPLLLTIDSHNDVGATADVIPKDLNRLNIKNETELGLFCWLRLCRLNDGQILPALYLDFFDDVYVLLNNKSARNLDYPVLHQKGKNGTIHTVRFFRKESDLYDVLINEDRPVFLDIDLDFFSNPGSTKERGKEVQWPVPSIKKFFSSSEGIISLVRPSIVGMTVALEPSYCGGFKNCFRALSILDQELFGGTMGRSTTKWVIPRQRR